MFLQSLASGLVFLAGLAGLRLAVVHESWTLLVVGLAVAVGGLAWLVLGGFQVSPAPRALRGRQP